MNIKIFLLFAIAVWLMSLNTLVYETNKKMDKIIDIMSETYATDYGCEEVEVIMPAYPPLQASE